MTAPPVVCQGTPSPAGSGPAPLLPGAFPGSVSGGQLLEEVVAYSFPSAEEGREAQREVR